MRANIERYIADPGSFKGLDDVVASTCRDIGEQFGDHIFDKYGQRLETAHRVLEAKRIDPETAVSNAIKEATNTSYKWGAPVNRDNRAAGGVHFSTYKVSTFRAFIRLREPFQTMLTSRSSQAICRRDGVFTNAQGPHEWNAQLAEPMIKVLAAGWEKTFTRQTPVLFNSFVRNAAELLKNFHCDIDMRARKVGLSIAGLHALKQQLSVYENILKDMSKEATDTMNNRQKEISRGQCFPNSLGLFGAWP